MKNILPYMVLAGFLLGCALKEQASENLLEELLNADKQHFEKILNSPEKYEVQILYTQIDRDKDNKPTFRSFYYRVDKNQYFYPASTVKFPASVVALEKIRQLGIDKDTPLRIDSAYHQQIAVSTDTTAKDGLPSIAHYIKKILLVSDNDAYNRLYEFIGRDSLNAALHRRGYTDLRMRHRLSVGDTEETARFTNPFSFYKGEQVIYTQPLTEAVLPLAYPLNTYKKGKGYMTFRNKPEGELINEPMDFSDKNYISVQNLQDILKAVIFPDAVAPTQRFNLTPDDYHFLYRYMSMYPKESSYPTYTDTCCNYDGYCKFFMFGNTRENIPGHIRIFNKVGDAYGYLIDNAYIADAKNGVEFMLTAVINVNENGIFNDDTYEYDTIGFPFMAQLGRSIYNYEIQRPRRYKPDFGWLGVF